jgi:replicative DNA helicase
VIGPDQLLNSGQQASQWQKEATDTTAVAPTGFREIDRYLKRRGFSRGNAHALLGRSGVGKTMFLCNLIERWLLGGWGVLFSSQEMTAAQVTNRLLAIRYRLAVGKIEEEFRGGGMVSQVAPHLQQYPRDFAGLTLFTHDRPSFRDLKEAWRKAGQPAIIVQDYMGRMAEVHDDGSRMYGSKKDKTEEVAWGFKTLARQLNVITLTLVQTSRSADGSDRKDLGHIPLTMDDAMYGGEASFDVMLGIFRPGKNPDSYHEDLQEGTNAEQSRYHRAVGMREKYGDNIIAQVLKNRFERDNIAGHKLETDWSTMRVESTTGELGWADDAW